MSTGISNANAATLFIIADSTAASDDMIEMCAPSFLVPDTTNLARTSIAPEYDRPLLTMSTSAIMTTAGCPNPENANADVARWLEVEPGAAVIRTARTTYDVDDSPVSIMTARIRPDRYELRYTLSSAKGKSSIPEVWRI